MPAPTFVFTHASPTTTCPSTKKVATSILGGQDARPYFWLHTHLAHHQQTQANKKSGHEHPARGIRSPLPHPVPRSLYSRFVKRFFDILLSSALIILLAPVMLLTWVAVRLTLGAPALFRDERAGRDGRPIRIAKFRSMTSATGPDGALLPDAERLGAFGRLLRRSSLDELPQLFSVLAGDMSLVGPRPLPLRYVARYTPRQATRLLVRPGITGWAQIHGRNAVAWPERLEYDAEYVERMGRPGAVLTDFWIVMVTMVQILWQAATGRGVSAPGSATMQEFAP